MNLKSRVEESIVQWSILLVFDYFIQCLTPYEKV